MTHGPMGRKIILFALPLALTGIMQQLFNAADVAVVGRFAGKEAMAAVGSNGSLIGLILNLFIGISLGANVVISQYIGQGSQRGVEKTIRSAMTVSIVGGILFAGICIGISRPVLRLLAVPDDVIGMSLLYLRIYLCGLPVIFLYNFEAAIFRSMGDTRLPLLCLVLSGLLNVCLNLVFVLCLGMTVDGVALATVLSNLASSAMMMAVLIRRKLLVLPSRPQEFLDPAILKRVLLIGIPAGLQGMLFSFANICIQSAINSLGSGVMAASSAAANIEILSYYMLTAFGQACTTFVGQNYGAREPARCQQAVRLCLLQGVAFTLSMMAFLLLGAPLLVGIFNTDPEIVRLGVTRIRYVVSAHIFSVIIEVLSGYLRGYGLSLQPALVSLFGVCILRLIWVYTLFYRHPSFSFLLLVYPVSLCMTMLLMTALVLVMRQRGKLGNYR